MDLLMSVNHKLTHWLTLSLWLALCFSVAWFGAQFSPGDWYAQLAKPPWTPPSWLFPPVWTILYAMMGVAAWLVGSQKGFAQAPLALSLFMLQLLLNGLWSWFFFGLQNITLGLVDIVLLWLALLATLIAFWRQCPLAGWLLGPYLVWVSYATSLNIAIWLLNP
jgi:tryptophan-rich sensory protein